MQKILHYLDKKHFGNQVLVYRGKGKSGELYFVVMKDRDEIVYFFVDDRLEKMYPVNSYIEALGLEINIFDAPNEIDIQFDKDLSNWGSAKCPLFLSELIKQNIHRLFTLIT